MNEFVFFGVIIGLALVIPIAFHVGFRDGYKKALNAYIYMDFRIMVEGTVNKQALKEMWHGLDEKTEDSFEGLARYLDMLEPEDEEE
jgi:hypothetical protein